MIESCFYNAYCDESCPLVRDGIPFMALGEVTCSEQGVIDVAVSMCESTSKGIKRCLKMSVAQS